MVSNVVRSNFDDEAVLRAYITCPLVAGKTSTALLTTVDSLKRLTTSCFIALRVIKYNLCTTH